LYGVSFEEAGRLGCFQYKIVKCHNINLIRSS